LLPALQRPPCLVAFSGGLDSSAVLAAATVAARKHALPLPIPATNRFPADALVDESAWQEIVVKHLGLDDWIRIEVTDELDLLGPVAAPGLLAHGVVWPPNAHFLRLLAAKGPGGTVLTGVGGDELFTPSAYRGARVLAREVRPRRGDLRAVGLALAPARLRRMRTQPPAAPPQWLRPEGQRRWVQAFSADLSREPLWWGRSLIGNWWRSRSRIGSAASAQAITTESAVEHPFMDPGFTSALAGARWRTGFSSRAAAMEFLCGDTVPQEVRQRADKAAFFAPFVNRYSRAFIEAWDGTGLEPELIDLEALRLSWQEERADARSYAALQAAWLAAKRSELARPAGSR
jgi:hypothetical protein